VKSRSAKNKGRRLQIGVAVSVAAKLGLTVVCDPPREPDGVLWVPEEGLQLEEGKPIEWPDLRVRRMGEPGADVALLSVRARQRVTIGGQPVWWECKNSESWEFGPRFWEGKGQAFVENAWNQARGAAPKGWVPVVVLGKNRWPSLAVWRGGEVRCFLRQPSHVGPLLSFSGFQAVRFDLFLEEVLDEPKKQAAAR